MLLYLPNYLNNKFKMLPDILEESVGVRQKPPSREDAKPTTQPSIPIHPDQEPSNSTLSSTPWKEGISFGISTIDKALQI